MTYKKIILPLIILPIILYYTLLFILGGGSIWVVYWKDLINFDVTFWIIFSIIILFFIFLPIIVLPIIFYIRRRYFFNSENTLLLSNVTTNNNSVFSELKNPISLTPSPAPSMQQQDTTIQEQIDTSKSGDYCIKEDSIIDKIFGKDIIDIKGTSFEDNTLIINGNTYIVDNSNIGMGSYGLIYKVTSEKNKNDVFIIKKFKDTSQYLTSNGKTMETQEISSIEKLSKAKCKFLSSKILTVDDTKYILMDLMDETVKSLFSKSSDNNLKNMLCLIEYLLSFKLCLLEMDPPQHYYDLHSDNIMYKKCKDGSIRFSFIDLNIIDVKKYGSIFTRIPSLIIELADFTKYKIDVIINMLIVQYINYEDAKQLIQNVIKKIKSISL